MFPPSYVLTLMIDSMRAVRSFHLDKAAASVLTTCVSLYLSTSRGIRGGLKQTQLISVDIDTFHNARECVLMTA